MPSFLTLIAALVLLAFLWMVWRASPQRPVNRRFSAFAVSIGCWATSVAAAHTGHSVGFWTAVAFASASFSSAAFLAFIAVQAPTERWASKAMIGAAFVFATILAALSSMTHLIFYDARLTVDGVQRETGGLYPVFAGFILLSWGSAFVLLVLKWKSARGRSRARLRYLAAGMVLPCTLAISTNLLWPIFTGRSTLSWIGPWLGLVFVAVVGHGIVRRRLPDLRIFVHQSLTLGFAIAISAVPAGILLAVFWPRLRAEFDSLELVFLLVSIVVVIVVTPLARDMATRLLNRYLYRTHANYQRTVLRASQMLTGVLALNDLLEFIGATVMRSTGAEGVAIYLLDARGSRRVFSQKREDADYFNAPSHAPVDVVQALGVTGDPILADELAHEARSAVSRLRDHLAQSGWYLLLPIVADNRVIAAIAVGSKRSGDPFYPQDLDLLMTLANQAGVAIKNAQLYAAVLLANEYLENIVATIESGVIAVDADGVITMFNRAAEHLTGMRGEATKGQSTASLPACLAEPLMATVATGEGRTQPEVDLPTVAPKEDRPASRPVICTVSPVPDQAGAVLGAVAVFSDLTPLKELELERRRAERLAYFQALAAGIAHEIKNPLVAIKTFAQLAPRRREDARFFEKFERIASRDIDRMERLLDRLRTLSRPAGGPRVPIDLRAPLSEAVELMQPTMEEKGLKLTAQLGEQPCVVLGNHLELHELFLNLLLNAHDATPTGGAIEVDLARTDSHVTLTVADTGPGISPELLERIFEPFFTTKPRGSGLGLAISAGIAQAHGARLRANNRPAGGAVFTVEFPLASVVPLVVS
jgi:PAS domain S-box-containing protein